VVETIAEDLLLHARELLANINRPANRRRAVAAAYYALFHLLIRDASANWSRPAQRSRLARTFEHKKMRDASASMVKGIGHNLGSSPESSDRANIAAVAQAFIDLQQGRQKADYDVEAPFPVEQAAVLVGQADLAFAAWEAAKDSELAHEYLYLLLFKDRS
jgi:hypothetical protein